MPSQSAKPHIVHVFPGFGIGGSQVRLAAIASGLGSAFSHTIISLSGNLDAASLLDRELEVSYAPPLQGGRGPLARLALYRRRLAQLKPDLLVTYNWGSMDFVLANFGRHTPHLHVEDGFGPEESKGQYRRRIWMRRFALSRSDLAVPSGTLQNIATQMWKLSDRRVHWIPNGIAESDAWSTSLADLSLNLPPDMPVVTWVGALRREKNPLSLLRAYAPVKDRAILLIVGDGSEHAEIAAEIERSGYTNARMLGYRKDARDIVMQSDILALSSDTEQMPIVVLEAMDAGLPVVSTNVGDVRNMVAPDNAKFVVSTPVDLAAAITQLVEDASLRRSIGAANRVRCRSFYSLNKMVGAWRTLLENKIKPSV